MILEARNAVVLVVLKHTVVAEEESESGSRGIDATRRSPGCAGLCVSKRVSDRGREKHTPRTSVVVAEAEGALVECVDDERNNVQCGTCGARLEGETESVRRKDQAEKHALLCTFCSATPSTERMRGLTSGYQEAVKEGIR